MSHMTAIVPSALRSLSVPAVAAGKAAKGSTQASAILQTTAATTRIAGHSIVVRGVE